jgi:hypothetical protein
MWWAGKDSNLGSRWQQIYSLPPLATWVPARNTLRATQQINPSAQLSMLVFFIRMTKKVEQAGPRTPPLPTNKDESVSWGHSLVQETLDSIDEVWRCQDPKTDLSCFYLRYPILRPSAEIFRRHPARPSLLFNICLSRYHTARAELTTPKHLTDISWAYGDKSFTSRTDRIVQPLDLNQKVPLSHAVGGWGKIQ